MPVIEKSSYTPPLFFRNNHISTCYPALFRRAGKLPLKRERLELDDGDFLDVDRLSNHSNRIAVIQHGMESNSGDNSVAGMARAFLSRGWDIALPNLRGCSGEPNRLAKFYCGAATGDLDAVLQKIIRENRYSEIALVGFSLGGNIVLRYAGEYADRMDQSIKAAAAVSVPCDLTACCLKLDSPGNAFYQRRFLNSFRKKIREKMQKGISGIDDAGYEKIRNFHDFDDRYTAPAYGYLSAEDYWQKASSIRYLKHIRIPALILNARDDPFLTGECFPEKEAADSPNIFLETPDSGGHVGFVTFGNDGEYWSETRVTEFIEKNIRNCSDNANQNSR